MGNEGLKAANKAKADEFYTQLSDIENELKKYWNHFKDKVVFCNCDDPYESNFFKYFALNFNKLGLKKLITTCYAGSPIISKQLSLLDVNGLVLDKKYIKSPYKLEINEITDINKDGTINMVDVEEIIKNKKNVLSLLKGDGDFRSEECLELLKQADIVVTNPPFSLFREYIEQLIENNKKFIVLGNMNAITYKDFFALIKNNQVWAGYGFNMSMVYKTPYPNKLEANRKFVISHGYNPDEGYVKVPGICWFTNLNIPKMHEKIILYKKYNPIDFPDYENYNAINVDKITDIPVDYSGEMGVPITFLAKYNPSQFKINGLGIVGSIDFTNNKKMEILDKNGKPTGKYTFNAKGTLYKKYNPNVDKSPAFKDCETGELYSSIYARIIIQRIDGDEKDGN